MKKLGLVIAFLFVVLASSFALDVQVEKIVSTESQYENALMLRVYYKWMKSYPQVMFIYHAKDETLDSDAATKAFSEMKEAFEGFYVDLEDVKVFFKNLQKEAPIFQIVTHKNDRKTYEYHLIEYYEETE